MLIEALRFIVVLTAVVAANRFGASHPGALPGEPQTVTFTFTVLGAAFGYLVGGLLARQVDRLMRGAEERLARHHASEVIAATLGSLVGLVIAAFAVWPVLVFVSLRAAALPVAASVALVIVSFTVRFAVRKRLELFGVLGVAPASQGMTGGCLLDASAAIDGRILPLYRAGLLPQPICVPSFILWELQGIADSQDPLRRRKGQRGLDVLTSLREAGAQVRVLDEDPAATTDPDAKLVIVARRRGLPVVTSDSNLAKAAELQGVGVLNLHGLAELLRPPVLPGETVRVKLVKAGREAGQAVGYLDDGTMVVVERARNLLGDEVPVEVTSILQTDTGRMLFSKLKDDHGGPELRQVGGSGE